MSVPLQTLLYYQIRRIATVFSYLLRSSFLPRFQEPASSPAVKPEGLLFLSRGLLPSKRSLPGDSDGFLRLLLWNFREDLAHFFISSASQPGQAQNVQASFRMSTL